MCECLPGTWWHFYSSEVEDIEGFAHTWVAASWGDAPSLSLTYLWAEVLKLILQLHVLLRAGSTAQAPQGCGHAARRRGKSAPC